MCLYVCVQSCVNMIVEATSQCQVLASITLHLILLILGLSLNLELAQSIEQLTMTLGICLSQLPRHWAHFHMGSRRPDSGPHACAAISITDPSPQLSAWDFKLPWKERKIELNEKRHQNELRDFQTVPAISSWWHLHFSFMQGRSFTC